MFVSDLDKCATLQQHVFADTQTQHTAALRKNVNLLPILSLLATCLNVIKIDMQYVKRPFSTHVKLVCWSNDLKELPGNHYSLMY